MSEPDTAYLLFEDGGRIQFEDLSGFYLLETMPGQLWIEQPPADGLWTEQGAASGTWVEQP